MYNAINSGKLICSHRVIVSFERTSWTGSYLVEPEDLLPDQTYRDVPVIEGDQEVFQCKVRVLEKDPLGSKITWDGQKHFNVSTSGERRIETSEDGVTKYYAVDDITVSIVDAAAIDEKSIWCDYGTPTIANTQLLFQAFVPGRSDFPHDLCESCNGTEYFKLSKATNKNTNVDSLSFNMTQMIKKKVMNKYRATDVVTDSTGNICGCL